MIAINSAKIYDKQFEWQWTDIMGSYAKSPRIICVQSAVVHTKSTHCHRQLKTNLIEKVLNYKWNRLMTSCYHAFTSVQSVYAAKRCVYILLFDPSTCINFKSAVIILWWRLNSKHIFILSPRSTTTLLHRALYLSLFISFFTDHS